MADKKIQSNIVILVTRNGFGEGDVKQQQTLFKKYINHLIEENYLPSAFCFYTEGVKLTVVGSPVIDELKLLEAKGVKLFVCLSCLKYYGAVDELLVGTIASMPDIIQAQWQADKVISG
jgi:sulfur relay (sulfurtransferase) complex TusBCD TusD component (DsrE family)